MPSSRALSRYLSVSRSTTELAYDQLASEGYIEALPCKGYYISQLEGIYFSKSSLPKQQNENTIAQDKQKKYSYDFALNEIAKGSFPYNVWQKLSRQVLTEADEEFFQLGNPCGEDGIRQAEAEYLYRSRGVRCKKEQILSSVREMIIFSCCWEQFWEQVKPLQWKRRPISVRIMTFNILDIRWRQSGRMNRGLTSVI